MSDCRALERLVDNIWKVGGFAKPRSMLCRSMRARGVITVTVVSLLQLENDMQTALSAGASHIGGLPN